MNRAAAANQGRRYASWLRAGVLAGLTILVVAACSGYAHDRYWQTDPWRTSAWPGVRRGDGWLGLPVVDNATDDERATALALRAASAEGARNGVARDQYNLGRSHCCGSPGSGGTFDVEIATLHLCKAARQGYGPAMDLLGRIYADVFGREDTPLSRSSPTLGPRRDALELAHVWFTLAAERRVSGAGSRAALVASSLSDRGVINARSLKVDWTRMPCRWRQVFPAR